MTVTIGAKHSSCLLWPIILLSILLIAASSSVAYLYRENHALQVSLHTTELQRDQLMLSRPTLSELKSFLQSDQTDKHLYSMGEYVCIQFARDLRLAARLAGWNFSYVIANFKYTHGSEVMELGHAFNGLYLSDGSFIYIEPRSDKIYLTIEALLGVVECDPNLGDDFICGDFTITTFVIIW